jgi:hypothetical protein
MAKKLIYHLYRIDWIDAKADGGWKSLRYQPEINDLVIHSVGWLINENKNYCVLAQQLSSGGQYSDTIQIPKMWMTSKRRLSGNIVEYHEGCEF